MNMEAKILSCSLEAVSQEILFGQCEKTCLVTALVLLVRGFKYHSSRVGKHLPNFKHILISIDSSA